MAKSVFEPGCRPQSEHYHPSVLGEWPHHIMEGFMRAGWNVVDVRKAHSSGTLEDKIKRAVRESRSGQPKIKTRIRMLSTHRAGPDDLHRLDYAEGESYEIPKPLADIFLREGWAKEEPVSDKQRTRDEKAKGKLHVRMLRTQKSSPDGIHTREYEKGEIYALGKPQADGFVREGWAEALDDEMPETGPSGPSKEPKKEE